MSSTLQSPPAALPDQASALLQKQSAATLARVPMALDALTVLLSVAAAIFLRSYFPASPIQLLMWHHGIFSAYRFGFILALLAGFIVTLLLVSSRLNLYLPTQLGSHLHEQKLNLQACTISGLLLTGALYIFHASDVSRGIVLTSLLLTTLLLSLRRAFSRWRLYRRYARSIGTRNVLIVGTGPQAQALRKQLAFQRHLGYSFRGYIAAPGDHNFKLSSDLLGGFEDLAYCARRCFADEVFLCCSCPDEQLQNLTEEMRDAQIDLRLIPDLHGGQLVGHPVEYVGILPSFRLHRCRRHEFSRALKRAIDFLFSALVLLCLLPFLPLVALLIWLDSPGPIFYASERVGHKGRTFSCYKLRTMVVDAEARKAKLMEDNERGGILFKMADDPRITRLGKFLRKYSIDELPQFFNVLRGDMSVVGPRPPIRSEVRQYQPNHLRRLDVIPGITGLWQVQGRQDPSFESYISLDVSYIENWSIWLDFKIVLQTIAVMLAGTGV